MIGLENGFRHFPGLISDELDTWQELTASAFEHGKPGLRISGNKALAEEVDKLLEATPLLSLGAGWSCVRAIAFNKSPDSNWALGWHQDRTIATKSRAEAKGFGPWSVKDGLHHVEPPFDLINRMITLRLHLDDAGKNNGALLVAPNSHRLGRISHDEIDAVAQRCGSERCDAKAGDGWLYATPILHASGRSSEDAERRVLQLDFSKDTLPQPLEWRGIA
jgi:ectoine hydroxylase-related dioxygenase (phytanoyl-CoA dioxygenase family)